MTKDEMQKGFDLIHVDLIYVLKSWLEKELNNLDAFLATPEEHVNYNPYVTLDYSAFYDRLDMLDYAIRQLQIIIDYREGSDIVTRSMYELAIEKTPYILIARLLSWMLKRKSDMDEMVNGSTNVNKTLTPLADYAGMFQFSYELYANEYRKYIRSVEGAKIVCEYKKETENLNKTKGLVQGFPDFPDVVQD